jgi:hypothetical protein
MALVKAGTRMRAARATRQAVLEHADRTAQGANAALLVATEIGKEWRVFVNMSFFGRMWWLLTGRITVSARTRKILAETLKEEAYT